ncbi:MAG: SynChlorMet cassette radical SAM/SPASM protein ScmE [Anaerolineales bacterium]|nr:SynChlorMet cassette radical SAM/SPASM protein ScmE [Anaerolineales bacterium]
MNGTSGAVMRTPRSLDLEITAQCNLRCRYCYYFHNPAVEYQDLPTNEWLSFLEELGSLGVMELTLSGGEAFLRPDIRLLISAIVKNRMRFRVLSNGALIDDDLAAFLAQTGRCNCVQVSLDGASPEVHDSCRGTGSFLGAVRGIRTLRRHGVKAAARVTIHRRNVGDLENIARLLLEDLGLEDFGTNAAGYLGSCRIHAEDILLTTAERQQAMDTLLRLEARYPGRIQAAAGPLAEGKMWRAMEDARRRGASASALGGRLTACGCTFERLTVRADGGIVPCSMLAHLVLGRINRDKLQEVWLESPRLKEIRGRSAVSLDSFEFCAGCEYRPYCTGNCPGLAYALLGRIDHPSPDACLRRFLADGGRLDPIPE